jgi:DNA-binding CsgD family transcriptional regulator
VNVEGSNPFARSILQRAVFPALSLLQAITLVVDSRRQQKEQFKTEFKSPQPLETLGLTPREAEILFWVAQGKTNCEIGTILQISSATAKKHLENIYAKLGTENRTTATLLALETLAAGS